MTSILQFITNHWKYIACFVFGLFFTFLIPSNSTKLLIDSLKEENQTKEEISKLKEQVKILEGQNIELEKKRKIQKEVSDKLRQELDSIRNEIKIIDVDIKDINVNRYKEIEKINNSSEKELLEFYKKLK